MKRAQKPKIDARDWRNRPISDWNTLTFCAFVADMNREYYGIERYLPFRNWTVERGMIKRNITQYGAEILREVFDAAFREYTPTREYPILTAGFVLSYMASRILPRLIAEQERRAEWERAKESAPSAEEIAEWL
jgi:hypothetical protein